MKRLNFGRKIRLNFGEDLFFFFFGDHLILGGKNLRIFEKFRLNFRTNRAKLIQEQSKFQNGPPFSKSWLRAWLLLLLLVCYYRDIIESASFIRN